MRLAAAAEAKVLTEEEAKARESSEQCTKEMEKLETDLEKWAKRKREAPEVQLIRVPCAMTWDERLRSALKSKPTRETQKQVAIK